MLAVATGLPGGASEPASVARGATPPHSDFLYAQPAAGIAPEDLGPALVRALGGRAVPLEVAPHAGGVRVRVPDGLAPAVLADELAASGLVRSVEGDAVVRAAQEATPQGETAATPGPPDPTDPTDPPDPPDPLFDAGQRAYLAAIGAPEAWASGVEASGVLIAVIDTGIDYDHPDLVPRLAVNLRDTFFDGIDDDGTGCPDDIIGCNFVSLATADPSCGYTSEPPHWQTLDDEGHGTFVAGVATATGGNEVGVSGVARDAMVLPVKVLDCTATGRISDAASGIRYAADMGADVVNISFGTPNDSPALREAIEYAQAHGAIIVASAGNDGSRGITFPAAYPGVLSVAASGVETPVGIDYRLTAPFALFGAGVDFLAPGVELLSTIPASLCNTNEWRCEGGPYARGTGSSFATPMVTGAVAVMLGAYPERSPEFVLALLAAARHAHVPGQHGRLLDIGSAVQVPLFHAGGPGTSRAGGGEPPGPAGP